MIFVASEANLITSFKPAVNGPIITHLQFADNTIIFCDAKEEQIKNVVAILRCFEAVSGLKVIFFKSELIGMKDHTLEGLLVLCAASLLRFHRLIWACLFALEVYQNQSVTQFWKGWNKN